MVEIATSNLNGIRAAERKGLSAWVSEHHPDVWCMQEVRAPQEAIDPLMSKYAGLYVEQGAASEASQVHVVNEICRIKGRAGVALLTSCEVGETRYGLPGLNEDVDSGRWVEQDLTTPLGHEITVVTAYIHSGDVSDPNKMHQKFRMLNTMDEHMEQLFDRAAHGGPQVVICGDYNICHTERDIKNAKGNVTHAGFLPEERAHITHWLSDIGYVDVTRELAGDIDGPYTWWSQRGHAFDTNAGWRIDYEFATPGIAKTALSFRVDKAETYQQRWSDHAALSITYQY